MIIALFSCFFYRPSIQILLCLLLPLVIDGGVQRLTSYESNNRRRFITGVLFGYSLVMLFVVTTIYAFQYGISIGYRIK